MEEIKDITDKIYVTTRYVKDVSYKCPHCKNDIELYDVDVGEYNYHLCRNCGTDVKFFVKDW